MGPGKAEGAMVQDDVSMMMVGVAVPQLPVVKPLPTTSGAITNVLSPGEGELFIEIGDKAKLLIEGKVLPDRRQFLISRDNVPVSLPRRYWDFPFLLRNHCCRDPSTLDTAKFSRTFRRLYSAPKSAVGRR